MTTLVSYAGPSGTPRFISIRDIKTPDDKLYWEIAYCSFPVLSGVWINGICISVRSDVAYAINFSSGVTPLQEYIYVQLPESVSFDATHVRLNVEADIRKAFIKEFMKVSDYRSYIMSAVQARGDSLVVKSKDEIPFDNVGNLPVGTKIETTVNREEVTVGGQSTPYERRVLEQNPTTTTITPLPASRPTTIMSPPSVGPTMGLAPMGPAPMGPAPMGPAPMGPAPMGPVPMARPHPVMPTSLSSDIMDIAAPMLPKSSMSAQVDAAKCAVAEMAKSEATEPQYNGEVKVEEPEQVVEPEMISTPEPKPSSLLGLKPLITGAMGMPEQTVPQVETKLELTPDITIEATSDPDTSDQVPATPAADTITTETVDNYEASETPTEELISSEPSGIPDDISGSMLPTVGDESENDAGTV